MSYLGLTVRIDDESAIAYLREQASRRGISISRLVGLVSTALCQRDAMEALLDDAEVHYRRAVRGRKSGDTHPPSYGRPRSRSSREEAAAELQALKDRLGIKPFVAPPLKRPSSVPQARNGRLPQGHVPEGRRESEEDLRRAVENTGR